ncbi:MAG: hypothetical protein NTU49_07560 [Gammaproteobacteria bacterium]|nr:hypothetical protein [Gammaproteobacteria bacterium]
MIKNIVLSAFLVSGAAVGSAILTLPILAAGPGLLDTLLFISATFILAYVMASRTLDVYARYENPDINAATLATDYFGKKGYFLAIILNVLCMGTCAAAYINAGGDLLARTVLPLAHVNVTPRVSMMFFFLLFSPVFIIGLSFVSRLTGVLVVFKFTIIIVAILLGFKLMNSDVFSFVPNGATYLGAGATAMFCIWGMHMTLPLVLKINQGDKKKAKIAVFLGLIIPAFIYVGWLILIFSLVARPEFLKLKTIGGIIQYALNRPELSPKISTLVNIFSNITPLTAFLAIGFSLVIFIIDAFKWKNNVISRVNATILALILPVIIAELFSRAFVVISQQANTFLIAAALIPIAANYKYKKENGKTDYKIELIVLTLGIVIIIAQALNDLGIFPYYAV